MKREMFSALIFLIFAVHLASASLSVEVADKGSVVIAELDNPAVFDFVIFNPGSAENIEIYSFVGLSFSPRGAFDISSGESTIEVKAYPSKDVRKKPGLYNFQYEIFSRDQGTYKNSLNINIVPLEEVFEVRADDLGVGDTKARLHVINKENTYVENASMHFSSPFFDLTRKISLKPYEEISFDADVDPQGSKTVLAGPYVFTASLELEDAEAEVEGVVNYAESSSISTKKTTSGFIVRKTIITKTNEGNVPGTAQVEISKDVLSRLFTTHAIAPFDVHRNALKVGYVWEKELQPGETFVVDSTTNYTFPFILLILVVAIGVFVSRQIKKSVVLDKRVSFVKTRGGEFALKVRVHVKAGKKVEKIHLVDRLPAMVQLYEKFGIAPDKIDSAARKLEWNIPQLNKGEERVFSYIIYSKMRIVGRFELPSASASFSDSGKTESVSSNRAFFVSGSARAEEN